MSDTKFIPNVVFVDESRLKARIQGAMTVYFSL